MRDQLTVYFKKAALEALGFVVIGIFGALLVAYSGFYSVAASRGHPAWLDWFLETGMRRSVQFHSGGVTPPALDNPDLVALGAGHFQGNCAACHGAPGEPVNPTYDRMLPSPPKLSEYASRWSNEELHWIGLHGIQYAGMPAWPATGREDEVWAVAAFVRRLPAMSESEYRQLASGNVDISTHSADRLVRQGRASANLTACARCHDTEDAAPTSAYVPRLAGQSRTYLANALKQYRAGARQSGFMAPVAAELDNSQIDLLADYYANISSPPKQALDTVPAGFIEKGRRLAAMGDAERGVPPCSICHAGAALPAYPILAGQPAVYTKTQLRLWRRGGRAETGTGKLMASIAERMSDDQIGAVAAFYQSIGAPAVPSWESTDTSGGEK